MTQEVACSQLALQTACSRYSFIPLGKCTVMVLHTARNYNRCIDRLLSELYICLQSANRPAAWHAFDALLRVPNLQASSI